MGPIWLLIGLALGVVLAAALTRRVMKQSIDALRGQLVEEQEKGRAAEAACVVAVAERDEAVVEALRSAGDWKEEVATLKSDLESERRLGAQLVAAERERGEGLLAAERRSSDEKLAGLTEVREELLARVSKTAGEAMDGRGAQLVERLKAEMATKTAEAEADLGKRQKAVEETVRPLKDSMKVMGEALEKIDIDRRKSNAVLGQQLTSLVEAQRQLRNETGTLSRALRQPHTRGRWGEMHLKRLLEMAGLSERCDFTEQTHVEDEGRMMRPDMVVHLPGGKDIVIDVKAPLAPYMEACEATDEATGNAHMKQFARGVRAHAKKLGAKDYAAQFANAPDFVLMYLPGEHFFSAAVEAEPSLVEDALRDEVLIATPTTMLVMLKTVAHSWQQERVAEEAQKVASLGQLIYERLIVFLGLFDRVSKTMNTAVEAQNKAVASLESRVLPAAREFPKLGVVPINKELPEARSVNQTARQVQAKEFAVDEPVAGLRYSGGDVERDAA
jgi:DNA recombination protein RmuC